MQTQNTLNKDLFDAYSGKQKLINKYSNEKYGPIGDIDVTFQKTSKNYQGMYNSDTDSINIATDKSKDYRSTLLHEIQHAIQAREGFEPGTNENVAKTQYINHLKYNSDILKNNIYDVTPFDSRNPMQSAVDRKTATYILDEMRSYYEKLSKLSDIDDALYDANGAGRLDKVDL